MRRGIWILPALSALAVSAGAEGRWVGFSNDEPWSEARIGMARTGTETVAFDLVVPGVGLDGASRADGDFVRLEIPGLDRVGEIGEPMLPALRRFVEIPQGAAAEVATAVLQRSTLDLAAEGLPATLCPVQAPMPTCDYGALTMVVGQ